MTSLDFLFQKTACPAPHTLDLYRQDLLPQKAVWHLENHLCECETCNTYIDEHQEDSSILDNLDAAFAVQLFLRETVCQPIGEYEAMLDMVLMSAATAVVTAPTDGDMVHTNKIEFTWKDSQLPTLWLSIENNLYEILFEGEIANGAAINLPKDEFRNGIYYYKLINGNDLVKVGKFYVYR